MTALLFGIDEVNWAELDSWTTEPENIPAIMQRLLSTDPTEAHEAYLDLAVDLVDSEEHEVFSASVTAIPFLFPLVENRAVLPRANLLYLLQELGTVIQPDWLLDGFDDTSDLVADDESFPVAHCVIAVSDAAPLYTRLLSDSDSGVRAAAALLLGAYRPEASIASISAAYDSETNPSTRASLLLCLAHYAMGGAAVKMPDLEQTFGSKDPVLKTAAAIASCLVERGSPPAFALEELARASKAKKLKYEGLFWNNGLLNEYASRLRKHLRA